MITRRSLFGLGLATLLPKNTKEVEQDQIDALEKRIALLADDFYRQDDGLTKASTYHSDMIAKLMKVNYEQQGRIDYLMKLTNELRMTVESHESELNSYRKG